MPFEYERKGEIRNFTIRNGSVNPMTPAMYKELYHHMVTFLIDDEVKVGIMRGVTCPPRNPSLQCRVCANSEGAPRSSPHPV